MTTSTPRIRRFNARFSLPVELAAGLSRLLAAHKTSLGDFIKPMIVETVELSDELCSLKAALRDLSAALDKRAITRIKRRILALEVKRG